MLNIMHAVDEFSHSNVTVSVENVSGSTRTSRVICTRALQPDRVKSVVELRTKSGTLVPTNTSTIVVTGEARNSCGHSVASTLKSGQVQVVVGVNVHDNYFSHRNLMVMSLHRYNLE